MWPWVLGSAALGGLQAYQQSGGDIGKTLAGTALGGGLGLIPGAAGGAVTRMAGARLAPLLEPMLGSSLSAASAARGLPLLGKLLPKAGTLAQEAALGSKISGAAKLLGAAPKLAGGLTATGIGMAVPGVAAGLAGAGRPRSAEAAPDQGTGPIGAAGKAAGLYRGATFQPTELVQPTYSSTAVPGGMTQPAGLADVFNPMGAYQAAIRYQQQEQDINNQSTMRLANYEVKMGDEVKRRDLLRNAAAARLKTDLATTSALMLGGQQIAGAQAQQALADIGATARTQYQYL